MSRTEKSQLKHAKTEFIPPDGGWGWIVAVSSGLIYFILFGILNSNGIFFMALVDHFGSRNISAWLSPVALAISRFIGPVIAYLANRFSYRIVVFIGGISLTIGFFTTYFVQNQLHMFISYSLFVGVGIGCIVFPVVTLTSLYFRNHLMLATGICSSGSSFGSILMPIIMNKMLDTQGFRGTIMILACLCLQICVFASLYQPVEWHRKRARIALNAMDVLTNPETYVYTIEYTSTAQDELSTQSNTVTKYELCNQSSNLIVAEITDDNISTQLSGNLEVSTNQSKTKSMDSFSLVSKCIGKLLKCSCQSREESSTKSSKMDFLRDPAYIILTITFSCSFFCYASLPIILPSFAVEDVGINRDQAALLLSIMSISDLVTRLGLSWIWDLKYFNRKMGYPTCIGFIGIIVSCLPHVSSFETLAVCVVAIGFFSGIVGILVSGLFLELIGSEHFAFAFSLSGVLTGIPLFVSGILIGSLKDSTGSYHASLYIVGALQLVTIPLWIGQWGVRKIQSRKRKFDSIQPTS